MDSGPHARLRGLIGLRGEEYRILREKISEDAPISARVAAMRGRITRVIGVRKHKSDRGVQHGGPRGPVSILGVPASDGRIEVRFAYRDQYSLPPPALPVHPVP